VHPESWYRVADMFCAALGNNRILRTTLAVIALMALAWQSNCAAMTRAHRPSPAAVRSAIRDILARPEFRAQPEESWRTAAGKWVTRTLSKVFQWIGDRLHLDLRGSSSAVRFLVALIVLAVAVLIFLLLLRLRNRPAARAPRTESPGPLVQTQSSQAELAKQALAMASNRDFPAAFRLMYLALLLLLDRCGVIRYHRSKTNWEYVKALKSAGRTDLAGDLEALSRIFDLTQYGSQPCGAGDYDACATIYRRVSADEGRPA
jgi:hypothetical protein